MTELRASQRRALRRLLKQSRAKAGVEAFPAAKGQVELVSRADVGRSASATSELMDVTAGETAPIPEIVLRQAQDERGSPAEPQASAHADNAGSPAQPAPPREPPPVGPDDDDPPRPFEAPGPDDGDEVDGDGDGEFEEELAALLERPRVEVVGRPPAVDWGRVAAARRALVKAPPAPVARSLEPALSPEECRRCGIPGRKGCAHQAPYEPPPVVEFRQSGEVKIDANYSSYERRAGRYETRGAYR